MATGHILPGYGNPVTRLRRAQSAYPLDKHKLHELAARNIPDLDRRTLDHIRQNARSMWSKPNYEPTTYNTFHSGDQLDEATESLPTEPQRRHKPHPKPVFLINRLHYVPGYHNPDATMGKHVYRVDDTFSEEERQLRRHQREKFIARPRTAAVDQYKEPWAELKEAVGPVEAWGAQAWLKTADDDHQHEVVNAIRDYRDKELFNVSKAYQCSSWYQQASHTPGQDPNIRGYDVVEKVAKENENCPKWSETDYTAKTENKKNQGTSVNCISKQGISGQGKLKEIAVKCALTNGDKKQENKNIETSKQKTPVSDHQSKMLAKSPKKAFPLKVMTAENDFTNTMEIDKIVNYVNNKFNQQGNKTKQSFVRQQKVQFRSPVQEGETKLRVSKLEETGTVEKKNDTEDTDKDATCNTGEIRILVQRQSPVPPPVADASPRPHTAIPSMHRWMKMAGAKESEQVRSVLYGGYPPSTIQTLGNLGYPNTTRLRRQEDIDNVRKGKYINRYPRGDFLIHPEYPPSFPHHRID